MTKTVAVVFAREDAGEFHRCSFPLLSRPVLHYPLLAASHADSVSEVFLSTASDSLVRLTSAFDGLRVFHRPDDRDDIILEFARAARHVESVLGEVPERFVFLFGNSPCVDAKIIEQALELMDLHNNCDSVITVERRREFAPQYAFKIEDGLLCGEDNIPNSGSEYFFNARLCVITSRILLEDKIPHRRFNDLFGKSIIPIVQEEGVGDIDYAWQVPICEHWLRARGFTESLTPYPLSRPDSANNGDTDVPRQAITSSSKTHKTRLLVTTVPFADIDSRPAEWLDGERRCEWVVNPIGRKLKEEELAELAKDFDILVAGTEPITRRVMEGAKRLKLISRVGIGLDSVDLFAARELGITVSYTPDAPAPAVAELTIGHILNLNRKVPLVDRQLREGVWQRFQGARIANQTIGIIGTGRVGGRVLRHLQGFAPKRVLVNDINPNPALYEVYHAELVDKEVIYREADIITLHVPLTPLTNPLITKREIDLMPESVFLINTARGGMIDEDDLFDALQNRKIAGAAIDVFRDEPYSGKLVSLENCFFSCHMGSCTVDCRARMEIEATEEALRFIRGEKLRQVVPEHEYLAQKK